MSSLLLPKHWRFNMPLLMAGHLKKGPGGHLVKTASGHLAKCADCLCEDFNVTPDCGCQTEDYGPFLTSGDVTITVTGSTIPTELLSKGGTCGFSFTGSSAPSIAGTYVISCEESSPGCWWHSVPVGCASSGGPTWFYVAGIRVQYGNIRLYHQLVGLFSGIDPYPTITGPITCAPLPVSEQWTRDIAWGSTVTYDKWLYVPGGSCTAECNESVIGGPECLSGEVTPYSDTTTGSGSPHPLSDITVTVEVDAPS